MIVSLTSPATKLLSIRFHFVDKYLCSLISEFNDLNLL